MADRVFPPVGDPHPAEFVTESSASAHRAIGGIASKPICRYDGGAWRPAIWSKRTA